VQLKTTLYISSNAKQQCKAMMQQLAGYLDELKSGAKVLPFRQA
jgi:hypothetical protein